MAGTRYKANNVSDEVKYSNLDTLVGGFIETRRVAGVTYFELHSGPGRSGLGKNRHDGSALRVLEILRGEIIYHEVFLHEKNDNLRRTLKRNIKPFNEHGNISVYADWRDEIEFHVYNHFNSNSLILMDPTHLTDYEGDGGLTFWLDEILRSGATVFMYAPQNVGAGFKHKKVHAKIVNRIGKAIKDRGRSAIDLMHITGRGYHKRIDHNIIAVQDIGVISDLQENHKKVSKRLKALKKGYPSFRMISY